ncbi:hypothetical protein AUO94_13870 [Planococcus kocurii]|uniref:Uncharacterized protein n=1 Tax=Planococcus kocurii TaxID=1374 RepID=A0ABM5WZ58_9BACL|nr:hypothetical protein AUO94_13870 [Planococcus kocurii]
MDLGLLSFIKIKKFNLFVKDILCKRFHDDMIQLINYWEHEPVRFHFLFAVLCNRLHYKFKGGITDEGVNV